MNFMKSKVSRAIKTLRNELLKREDLYDGFAASITSALKDYGYCGHPFEPEEYFAEKILERLIGEDCFEKE